MSAHRAEAVQALQKLGQQLREVARLYPAAMKAHRAALDAYSNFYAVAQAEHGEDLEAAPAELREAVQSLEEVLSRSGLLTEMPADDGALAVLEQEAEYLRGLAGSADALGNLVALAPLTGGSGQVGRG